MIQMTKNQMKNQMIHYYNNIFKTNNEKFN